MTRFGRRPLAIALVCILLFGCAPAEPAFSPEPAGSIDPLHTPRPENPPSPEEQPTEGTSPQTTEPLGVGTAVFADTGELTPGQQEAVLSLLTRYYDSLAGLALRDPADLFAPEAAAQYLGNRAVWEYVVQIRRMQRTDLGLLSYEVELNCQEIEENEDGSVSFRVTENSVQNFRATWSVDSEQKNVYHQFALVSLGEDRWAVSVHTQLDSLYRTVMGQYAYRPSAPDDRSEAEIKAYYEDKLEELLATAKENVAARLVQGEERPVTAGHSYDRGSAVAYARQWVGIRSGDWPDYSRNGGNCQNFVSQCLYAGGIPMDVSGPSVWKWYGSTPNNLPQPAGRSASWSAVVSFLDYVESNTGYGLAAVADAPYYSGSPGDIIHLGDAQRWRHTVLITGLVEDGEGNTEDYLICSNTADLRDFPVSAYAYTRQLLIRVAGWNG